MDFEDKLKIETPEGVSVEVPLAGAGSRMGAAIIDGLIQLAIIFALGIVFSALVDGARGDDIDGSTTEVVLFVLAIFTIVVFLVLFFYFTFFETLWAGRTPGKRAFGLRVVRLSGARIGFLASFVRNLLRLVDILPSLYLIGLVSILVTERNQRLGDLVAGTIVVREPQTTKKASPKGAWSAPSVSAPARSEPPPPETASWDVSGITAEELATVRSFLERRHSIPMDVRYKLAQELASKLRPKVPGAPPESDRPEIFLEKLAAAKSARS